MQSPTALRLHREHIERLKRMGRVAEDKAKAAAMEKARIERAVIATERTQYRHRARLVAIGRILTQAYNQAFKRRVAEADARAKEENTMALSFILARRLHAGQGTKQTEFASNISINDVVHISAHHFDIPVSDILISGSIRRNPNTARARWVTSYICYKVLGRSYASIGRALNKDHTSILHGCRQIEKFRHTDETLNTHVVQVAEKVWAHVGGLQPTD